jgi:PAS domain S-box-containing protein
MGTPIRVLIVEDSAADAELTVRELARSGYDPEALRVDTAEAMRAAMESGEWDVILADYNMPRFDAESALRLMKERHLDVPFLIVSGSIGEQSAVAAMKAGAHDYIMKDGLARLVPAVERELREAQERRKRRQAEQALRRSEARFRQLIERSPDGIAVCYADRIIYVNPVLAALLGRGDPEALAGKDLLGFVHPEDRDAAAALLRAPIAKGEPGPMQEVRFLSGEGNPVVAEVTTVALEFDGRSATAVMVRDVTERKQMQSRLLQADRMASVGILAAGVAHEINNPLAYVIANLEFLAQELPPIREKLDGDAAELETPFGQIEQTLLEAREGAERVRLIVRDLKTFSRIDEEDRGPVNLVEVIGSSLNMVWSEIRDRARLVKEFGATPAVDANVSRLGQVFLNLLINAAQALPEGEAERNEIRILTRTDERGYAVVEVSDTGAGIPQNALGRVFDPFFTTKPVGVGTGLGLSICHNIVSSLGGVMEVETRFGQGTTFRVILPPAGHGAAARRGERALREDAAGPRARVLVVDDEQALGSALARALGGENDVVVTHSGGDALRRLLDGQPFDLILCDLIMPEVTGMDLYETLARERPALLDRVVFMTSGAFTPRARAFVARLKNPCLEKPLDLAAIRTLIRQRVRAG